MVIELFLFLLNEFNNIPVKDLKIIPGIGPLAQIASIASKCKGKNAASSLAQLATYLSHSDPEVKKAAAEAIARIIIEVIPKILDDPTLTNAEKKQIAREICEVFDRYIAPKMGVFSEIYGEKVGKIIALMIYEVIATLRTIVNSKNKEEKKNLLYLPKKDEFITELLENNNHEKINTLYNNNQACIDSFTSQTKT